MRINTVTLVVMLSVPMAGCQRPPEDDARAAFYREVPGALIASEFVSSKTKTLCGETKGQEYGEPPGLFYVSFDGKTVHTMDEPNASVKAFLEACGVTSGTSEASRLRSRWQELDSARIAKQKSDADRERYLQERAQQQKWIEDNADSIRALHEASQRLSR
jgi:hypothetical protein